MPENLSAHQETAGIKILQSDQLILNNISYWLNRWRDAGHTYGVTNMHGIKNRGACIIINGAQVVDGMLLVKNEESDDRTPEG